MAILPGVLERVTPCESAGDVLGCTYELCVVLLSLQCQNLPKEVFFRSDCAPVIGDRHRINSLPQTHEALLSRCRPCCLVRLAPRTLPLSGPEADVSPRPRFALHLQVQCVCRSGDRPAGCLHGHCRCCRAARGRPADRVAGDDGGEEAVEEEGREEGREEGVLGRRAL